MVGLRANEGPCAQQNCTYHLNRYTFPEKPTKMTPAVSTFVSEWTPNGSFLLSENSFVWQEDVQGEGLQENGLQWGSMRTSEMLGSETLGSPLQWGSMRESETLGSPMQWGSMRESETFGSPMQWGSMRESGMQGEGRWEGEEDIAWISRMQDACMDENFKFAGSLRQDSSLIDAEKGDSTEEMMWMPKVEDSAVMKRRHGVVAGAHGLAAAAVCSEGRPPAVGHAVSWVTGTTVLATGEGSPCHLPLHQSHRRCRRLHVQ